MQGTAIEYPSFVFPYASQFKRKWTIFITLLAIYQAILYPYELAVIGGGLQGGNFNAFYVVEIIAMIIFIVDMIINFRTTYPDQNNEEIIKGDMMAKNYIKRGSFFIDLIATLPVPEILLIFKNLNIYGIKYYYLVRLLRVWRINQIDNLISNENHLTFIDFTRKFVYFMVLVIIFSSSLVS